MFLVVSCSETDIFRLRIKLRYCLLFTKPPFLAFKHTLNKMAPDAKWCSCLQEIFLENIRNVIPIRAYLQLLHSSGRIPNHSLRRIMPE